MLTNGPAGGSVGPFYQHFLQIFHIACLSAHRNGVRMTWALDGDAGEDDYGIETVLTQELLLSCWFMRGSFLRAGGSCW